MGAPRYFVRPLYASTVEDFVENAGKHGDVVEIRCHYGMDGKSVAGAVEVVPEVPESPEA